MTDSIVSAGIDIGTSTTHITISRLLLQNTSSSNRIPKLSVTERQIIYQSPIYPTPLNADNSINAEAVARLLSHEYSLAKFERSQINTGAVIITGESARLRNARELSMAIAEMAGDFVVASAGCYLESLLAGRGSGAAEASRLQSKTICNIDIGGGTCNYAVFRNGKLIDSSCLGIGGRCIQFDSNGCVSKFTDSGETFLDGVGKLNLLQPGSMPDEELLELIAALLSEVILHVACSPSPPQIAQRLLQTEALRHDYEIDEYWVSGGIAECLRNTELAPFAFGDLGVYLAAAFHAAAVERGLSVKIAEFGIRATVIGAGMHSLQLSGCTILVSKDTLPLRNIQIVHPFAPGDAELSEEAIAIKLSRTFEELADTGETNSALAIAICNLSALPYSGLQAWARALAAAHKKHDPSNALIILSREDIGLALGQTIKLCSADIELVILDDVDTSMGDFIDIGKALENRESVPLTVKTLIFNH